MIKKTSSNQPCGRDSEYITGAFLKSFSIFHNREKLHVRLRQACTFETKLSGLVSIQTVWHLNFVIVERLF